MSCASRPKVSQLLIQFFQKPLWRLETVALIAQRTCMINSQIFLIVTCVYYTFSRIFYNRMFSLYSLAALSSRYIFDAAGDGDLASSDLSMPFSWIRYIAIFRKAMSHACHIVTHAALFLWCFRVGVFAMIHKPTKLFSPPSFRL